MARSPSDTVRRLYEAFETKDEAALRELISADVEWNQCEGFPGGARRRGVDDVLSAVFGGNRATWTGFSAPVAELLASGERVVALGHYEGTHADTEKHMQAVFAHVYTVRDGQIIRFDQVADTWPMVAAMQP
jgi:ketosteroid isomerase-like protein